MYQLLCETLKQLDKHTHLWKEPSIRSLALFLDVAISQPRARPSASRILAFLPEEHRTNKRPQSHTKT